jgi:hypothetical protein
MGRNNIFQKFKRKLGSSLNGARTHLWNYLPKGCIILVLWNFRRNMLWIYQQEHALAIGLNYLGFHATIQLHLVEKA